jgi:hypothetical protein
MSTMNVPDGSSNSGSSYIYSCNSQEDDFHQRLLVERACLLLPDHVIKTYVVASLHAPSLVASETDPLLFLRHENNNAKAAALKLCSYWSKRLLYYGSERAFLPMNLSGTGTVSGQDIETLKQGYTRLLPNDNHGRGVLLINESTMASCLTATGVWCFQRSPTVPISRASSTLLQSFCKTQSPRRCVVSTFSPRLAAAQALLLTPCDCACQSLLLIISSSRTWIYPQK